MNNRGVIRNLILAAVVAATGTGCLVQTDNSVQGDRQAFSANQPRGSDSFMKVSGILRSNCASCHGADIASYSEEEFIAKGLVVPHNPKASVLYERLKGSGVHGSVPEDMPKDRAPLSSGDLNAIRDWITNIGIESPVPPSPTPSPSGSPGTLNTAFRKVQDIFRSRCVSCHVNFIPMSEADFISQRLVVPGNASQSRIYNHLIGTNVAGAAPPSMPLAGPPLNGEDLQAIEQWIDRMPPAVTPTSAIAAIAKNFETNIRPIVKKGCMECHDSRAAPQGLIGWLPIGRQVEWDHIRKGSAILDFSEPFPNWSVQNNDPLFFLTEIRTVLSKSTMPIPSYKIFHEFDGELLTYDQDRTIMDWIDQSMKLWAQANPRPPTATQFFSSRCFGCHNSSNASGGLAFQKNGDQLTVPGGKTDDGTPFIDRIDPANSAVYRVLLTDPSARKGLAQMPDGDVATDAERALVLNWLKSGAR